MVRLRVREARSLKDKRQVVRSIIERLREKFGLAVAEVEALDNHQLAVLGIAAVGDEAAPVKRVLDEVANYLRKHPIAEFCSCEVSVDRSHWS